MLIPRKQNGQASGTILTCTTQSSTTTPLRCNGVNTGQQIKKETEKRKTKKKLKASEKDRGRKTEGNIEKTRKTAFVFRDIIMNNQYVAFMISLCSELHFFTKFHANKFVLTFTEQNSLQILTSFYSEDLSFYILIVTSEFEERFTLLLSLESLDQILILKSF